ncbi:MAG: dockerin type I domain-containing protein [Chthoniobacterales bacterium]
MVNSPNPPSSDVALTGVAPLSGTDVWAVGSYIAAAGGTDGSASSRTLAMHWNGASWTITPTVNPATSGNQLKKVIALASNNVWSLGGDGQSYTLRWDGANWLHIPLPPINNNGSSNVATFLEDIAATSGSDIWLVGAMDNLNGGTQTLTLHWNGAQWMQIPNPNIGTRTGGIYSQGLESVVALTPNNVWAVGHYRVGNTPHTLILHWDGTAWTIVPSPDGPTGDGWLHSIAAANPNDIWAVGEYDKVDLTSDAKALALHWDGVAWTASVPPNPSPFGVNPLHSVVARGPNDFYAAGSWQKGVDGSNTFTVHWDGATWTQVPSDNPAGDGTGENPLLDLGRDAAGGLWAVGKKQSTATGPSLTLVERATFAPTALAMSNVVSRKTHGATGTFDIDLPTAGAPGIESRLPINGEHVLVYTFTTDVASVDNATISAGTANVASRALGPNPNQYTVHLTGIPDVQHVVVQLDGVRNPAGEALSGVSAQLDVVVGDVNASRAVNSSDIAISKAAAGAAVTAANFRADVTANGSINSTDVAVVKARSGGGL